jgi:general secretion pathway protein C
MQWMEHLKAFDRQRLNKLGPIALLIFLLCLCWKLAALFWLLIAPPQMMNLEAVQLGSQQMPIPNITQFALFKEVGQNSESFDDSAPMTLQGVMESSPAQYSSAVIKVNDAAERYRVGEMITGTAYQLLEVTWDHVVLKHNNGSTRALAFQGLPNGLNQPLTPAVEANSSVSNDVSEPAENQQDRQLGQASQQLNENRDQYLKDMGLNAANGGMEITTRTPALLRQKLALQPGDRILSLNGQTLSAGQTEAQLLEQARQQGHARLEIKRGDQTMTIQQDLK